MNLLRGPQLLAEFFRFMFLIESILSLLALPATSEEIVSLEDTRRMFATSETEWKSQVEYFETTGAGFAETGLGGGLLLAVDLGFGFLTIEPVYAGNNRSTPYRLHITSVYRSPEMTVVFNQMKADKAEAIISKAMSALSPEFTTIGFLRRAEGILPRVSFTVFRKGTVPEIDELNEAGSACFESCINPSRSLR